MYQYHFKVHDNVNEETAAKFEEQLRADEGFNDFFEIPNPLNRVEIGTDGVNIYTTNRYFDFDGVADDFDEYMQSKLRESGMEMDGHVEFLGHEGWDGKTLYHITERANLDSILTNGLTPAVGDNSCRVYDNTICLTEKEDIAAWMAVLPHIEDPVLITVDTEGLNTWRGKYYTDRDFTLPAGYGEWYMTDPVPASHIRETELTDEFKAELYSAAEQQVRLAIAGNDLTEKSKKYRIDLKYEPEEAQTGLARMEKMLSYTQEVENSFTDAVAALPAVEDGLRQ